MGEQSPRYDQRVHALVSDAQKKEWKEATEGDDSDYESVSSLIRTAVQRELADSNPALEGENAGTSAEVEETVLEMADRLESIESQLSSVERRLSRVEVESDEDALDLQGRILNALPTSEDKDIGLTDKWAMTVPEATSLVGSDEDTVASVLDQLAEEMGVVERRYGGEPAQKYYYRRA
jgi:Arc/MetJ-type ribon-helix-helix transcriptional regulator